jgi:hypothetical protein
MMQWKLLVPRYRSFEDDKARISSFRWLGFGWDNFVFGRQCQLTQWGRKAPLRFICRFKGEPPTFLYSHKWEKTVRREGFVGGITKRPLEVGQLWGKIDAAYAKHAGNKGAMAVLRGGKGSSVL